MVRKKQTKARVREGILARYKSGKDMSEKTSSQDDSALVEAAKKLYRGWYAALDENGIPASKYRRHRSWTSGRVKEGILARYKSDKDMSEKVSSEDDSSLVEAAKRIYRGWYAALDDLGVPSAKYRRVKSWDRESVISTLKDHLRQGENVRPGALHKKHSGLLAAGERVFGSARAMYEAAGITPDEIDLPRAWSKDNVLSELRRRYASGADMRYSVVRKENPALVGACEGPYYYGSYYKSLEIAGIPADTIRTLLPRGYWSNDRIITEIRKLVSAKERMNDRFIQLAHGPLYGGAQRAFGSWEKAVEAAGFDYDSLRSQRKPYTQKELVDTLRGLKEQGVPLDNTSVRSYDPRLIGGIIRVFGSYRRGLEALGLNYDDVKRTWQFEKIKGEIFEDHVGQVLKIVRWKVEHQKQFKFANCKCIPDFYDTESRAWIDAKLTSWTLNVEASIDKYLAHTDRIIIIYLNESRTKSLYWNPDKVEFIPIKRFYPELKRRGADRLVENLELLRRGVIFKPEHQTRLREFVLRKYPMKSGEVMRFIQTMAT